MYKRQLFIRNLLHFDHTGAAAKVIMDTNDGEAVVIKKGAHGPGLGAPVSKKAPPPGASKGPIWGARDR